VGKSFEEEEGAKNGRAKNDKVSSASAYDRIEPRLLFLAILNVLRSYTALRGQKREDFGENSICLQHQH